jgi:hypothetical protein
MLEAWNEVDSVANSMAYVRKRTMVLLAAKLNSSVMTEAEHRMKTMAPETVEAAYRFPLSVTCTRFGTMMSCY